MIVKNESDTIISCLDSLREHADSYVIVDTGSEDGTVEMICEYFAKHDLDGEVYEREWVNFGHNRTEALDLARGRADYILVVDADWHLQATSGAFDHLDAPWYLYKITDGISQWYNARLLKNGYDWRFVGMVHEQPHAPGVNTSPEILPHVTMQMQSVGGLKAGRYTQDIAVIRSMIETEGETSHLLLHFAKTYQLLGQNVDAMHNYQRLIGLNVTEDLDCERIYFALWQLGVLCEYFHDKLVYLERANAYRPERKEAIFEMLQLLRRSGMPGQIERARLIANKLEETYDVPQDMIAVIPAIYNWALLRERALVYIQSGYTLDGKSALEKLLTLDLPDISRNNAQENLLRVNAALAKLK